MNPNNIRIRIRSQKHYSLTSGMSENLTIRINWKRCKYFTTILHWTGEHFLTEKREKLRCVGNPSSSRATRAPGPCWPQVQCRVVLGGLGPDPPLGGGRETASTVAGVKIGHGMSGWGLGLCWGLFQWYCQPILDKGWSSEIEQAPGGGWRWCWFTCPYPLPTSHYLTPHHNKNYHRLLDRKMGAPEARGEYFSISRDTCPCIIFFFSCSYIQIRVFRAEILVRNSYA